MRITSRSNITTISNFGGADEEGSMDIEEKEENVDGFAVAVGRAIYNGGENEDNSDIYGMCEGGLDDC